MKSRHLIAILATFTLTAGCVAQQVDVPASAVGLTGTAKSDKFKFEVDEDAEQLVPKNGKTPGCEVFPEALQDGCFVAGANDKLQIEFKLDKSNGWWFSEFQICAAPDFDSPGEFKKPETCELSADQRVDFLVDVDGAFKVPDASGKVELDDQTRLRRFFLRNQNWESARYFYRIEACTGERVITCVETDPGGINTGTGGIGF
jgi:hypothetical protein